MRFLNSPNNLGVDNITPKLFLNRSLNDRYFLNDT